MPIIELSLLLLGYLAIQLISWIMERICYWREKRKYVEENQEYFNQVEAMDAQYRPEPPDVELAEKCGAYLSEKFPSGIETAVQNMSGEDLLALFVQMESDAEQLMGVNIANVDFYESETPPTNGYMGYYDHADNSIHINKMFILSGEPILVKEQVSTLFHELKHARQWKAIEDCANDQNTLGYSDDQITLWAENFTHYIPTIVNDELYRKQPVEVDSFGFEKLVIAYFENNIA